MSHFANLSEENYLKTLFGLSQKEIRKVNNVALAQALGLNPATVLEMVRKLIRKNLLEIRPDKSIVLTEKGRKKALQIVRKHRLWEVFLVDKLNYAWNEVHELAEQLEHVESADLIDRLEAFLDYPVFDPHGDPIPDKHGRLKMNATIPLSSGQKGKVYQVMNFAETEDAFLDYLSKIQVHPGVKMKIKESNLYDQSIEVVIQKRTLQISEKVAKNILVQPG